MERHCSLILKKYQNLCWVTSHTGNSEYKVAWSFACSFLQTPNHTLPKFVLKEGTADHLDPDSITFKKKSKILGLVLVILFGVLWTACPFCLFQQPQSWLCLQELTFPSLAVFANHPGSVWNTWLQLPYLCMISIHFTYISSITLHQKDFHDYKV